MKTEDLITVGIASSLSRILESSFENAGGSEPESSRLQKAILKEINRLLGSLGPNRDEMEAWKREQEELIRKWNEKPKWMRGY